jgi:hypothetical protein
LERKQIIVQQDEIMMKNIFDENIQCTDPDMLQFCLSISEHKFWYCEPNFYHNALSSDTPESRIYIHYSGYPEKMMEAAREDKAVNAFLQNSHLWVCGEIDVRDFRREEQIKLLADYGYRWENFDTEAERNQLVCEIYFETYPMDFRNDI